MRGNQQSSTGKSTSLLRVIKNQVRIEQDIKLRRPDLAVVPLPTILKVDFDQLVSEHRRSLVKTAYRTVRNWETAEDIVQTALVKAYKNLSLGRPYVMPKNRLAPSVPKDSKAKTRCPVSAKIDITIGRIKEYPPTRVAEQIGAGRGYPTPHVVAPDCRS